MLFFCLSKNLLGQILDNETGFVFGKEVLTSLYEVQKRPPFQFFEDEVKVVSIFKVLEKLNDVGMALTQVVRVNLAKNLGSTIKTLNLLNDLHRINQICCWTFLSTLETFFNARKGTRDQLMT